MKKTVKRSLESKRSSNLYKAHKADTPASKLAHAISLQQQWRFEDAKAQYLELLNETPDDANAQHNLGVLFSVALLEPAQALPYFEVALSLQPSKLQFWYSYLDALIKAGTLDVAEQVLKLASNYGLNERQINAFTSDIRLARTNVDDLVNAALAEASPLPQPQPIAAPAVTAAIEPQPSMADLQQLLNVFNQKKYAPTVKAIQAMLQRFPQAAVVWTLLAEAEKRGGFPEKALQARSQAAALEPSNAATQMAWADALWALNHQEQASFVLEAILRMQPNYAPALGKMGQIYQQQGLIQKALHSYGWALRCGGANPVLLERFGSMLRALGNQDGALVCFKLAVESSPHAPELLDVYGETLFNQSRLAAAENAFRSALKIDPGYIPALRHLCHLLEFHGRFAEAEAGLLRCNQIEKGSPEALFEVGRNLSQQKRDREAVDWLRRAVKAKPDFVAAHIGLSAALSKTEAPETVLEEIKASVKKLPNVPALHTNLGITSMQLSRTDEAIASFRKALSIDPNFDYARSCLLFALSHSSKVTPQELFLEHRNYGEKIEERVKGREYSCYENTRVSDRPLKIGFVSGDFRNHAVAKFVIPFFKALKKHGDIISYAYSNHGARDASTIEIEQLIHVWQQVAKWTDEQLAEKIREDGIDILIDVSGHTEGHRLSVFARHPAPVQVTWLGYPCTTGLKAMDYKLINAFELKPEGKADLSLQFVEKLALFPPSFVFKEEEQKTDTGDAPCLKNGYLTFGSFNRLNKISHEVVLSWCQVLKALPESRMVMGAMPSDGVPAEVIKWFEDGGVSIERITFLARTNLSDYLRLHSQVDLCLDTFPYTGGTTTLHALWMGVPTLTIAGDTSPARQSSSTLHCVGLEKQCVAHSAADLIDLAKVWAQDPEMVNRVRRSLQTTYLSQEGVATPEIAVKGMVYAMRQMWQRWCAGAQPARLEVGFDDIGESAFPINRNFDICN